MSYLNQKIIRNSINTLAEYINFKTCILYLMLLPNACASSTIPSGYYTGIINPTSPSNSCEPGHAILNIQNGQVLFVPNEATWTLQGTADPDGKLQAERTARSANKQSYSARFIGTWANEAVSGTYTNLKCTYAVNLARHR